VCSLCICLQYLVLRKGIDMTEYGKVDARAAKRQRMMGDGVPVQSTCPVSIDMVEEYEQFKSAFWAEVREHTEGGVLDMGEWV
jgi:hypothetical protein